MKNIILIYILTVFSILSVNAQHIIKLKLKDGHEYVLNKTGRHYRLNQNNEVSNLHEHTKIYKVTVEKINEDNTVDIVLRFQQNFKLGGYLSGYLNRTDFFYPEFRDLEIQEISSDFKEYFFCKPVFQFRLNLTTNDIELTNRVELLEQFHKELRNYSKEQNDGLMSSINKWMGELDDELLSFLTWFNHALLNDDNTLISQQLEDKLQFCEKKGDKLAFGEMKPKQFISGKTYKNYWLDTETGITTNYSTIRYDSIKTNSFEHSVYKARYRVAETKFQLTKVQKVPENKIFVSGKIEHPLSNSVNIRFLDKPFGVDQKTKTVVVDENGTFQTTFEYKHAGFIYVENSNNNTYKPPGTYVFYAEPGDSIIFSSSGKELPWKTTVLGNRATEAQLLMDLRMGIKLPIEERLSNTIPERSNLILDGGINAHSSRVNGRYIRIGNFDKLFQELKKIDSITENYKSQISEDAYKYITKEVKSYFYSGIYQLSVHAFNKPLYEYASIADREDLQKYLPGLDSLNLLDYYNDYGLYSRQFATNFLAYNFIKANKTTPMQITSSSWSFTSEPELKKQFARLILSGSSYYREMASTYSDILIERHRVGARKMRSGILKEIAVENLELMALLCNDEEIVSEAKHLVKQYKRLLDNNYLPQMELLNLDGNKVVTEDYKGNKPTIFYASSNWTGDRYGYDELAKENPNIQFVMVLEGSSFQYWKDYTARAEPIAEHLLLLSDTSNFNELFHKNSTLFVLNKDGELEGYARSLPGAVEMAKDSTQLKKKELTKGELQFIIIILVSILTALIIGLIIWKWRVRQRFRKEEQNRKLRELELTAIRSQMNPHFLFNALNSVQNLVQQNKGREAHLYLANFAGLIRKVLNNSEKEEVSLAEELEMTEQYLTLEKLRFDFEFKLSVSEEIDSHNTLVPSMLLQPFVENAVIHGLQSKAGDKQLKIEISKVEQGINISIEDNGIGRAAAKEIAKAKNGKGTKLMKERLEILQEKQGEKYSLEIIDLEVGTRVDVVIPEES